MPPRCRSPERKGQGPGECGHQPLTTVLTPVHKCPISGAGRPDLRSSIYCVTLDASPVLFGPQLLIDKAKGFDQDLMTKIFLESFQQSKSPGPSPRETGWGPGIRMLTKQSGESGVLGCRTTR